MIFKGKGEGPPTSNPIKGGGEPPSIFDRRLIEIQLKAERLKARKKFYRKGGGTPTYMVRLEDGGAIYLSAQNHEQLLTTLRHRDLMEKANQLWMDVSHLLPMEGV